MDELPKIFSDFNLPTTDIAGQINDIQEGIFDALKTNPDNSPQALQSEFQNPKDMRDSGSYPLPGQNKEINIPFFRFRFGTPVGPVMFHMDFHAGGTIGISFDVSVQAVNSLVKTQFKPFVVGKLDANLHLSIIVASAGIDLMGYVMRTTFPLTLEANYTKQPIVATKSLEVELIPVELKLEGYVKIGVWKFAVKFHKFTAEDDDSDVKLFYAIGDYPGGTNVVGKIMDGKGASTVFNGNRKGQELRYTIENYHASDIADFTDPHASIENPNDWTNTGLVKNLHLPDGEYHVTAQAVSDILHGGDLVTTVCHSAAFLVDTDPPHLNSVNEILFDDTFRYLVVYYSATDDISGIARMEFGLGKTKALQRVFRDVNGEQFSDYSFAFEHGDKVHTELQATNRAGGQVSVESDGLLVDRTPPELVHLGTVNKTLYQTRSDALDFTWEFRDPESGISEYRCVVLEVFQGTKSRFWPDHQDFHSVQLNETSSTSQRLHLEGLSLMNGGSYSLKVTAVNGAKVATAGESGVVTIDTTPPAILQAYVMQFEGQIYYSTVRAKTGQNCHEEYIVASSDGYMVHVDAYQSSTSDIRFSWTEFESDMVITHYYTGDFCSTCRNKSLPDEYSVFTVTLGGLSLEAAEKIHSENEWSIGTFKGKEDVFPRTMVGSKDTKKIAIVDGYFQSDDISSPVSIAHVSMDIVSPMLEPTAARTRVSLDAEPPVDYHFTGETEGFAAGHPDLHLMPPVSVHRGMSPKRSSSPSNNLDAPDS
nr:hypothetical protein BaRGS_011578 [Batillaria attramentaria]